MHRVPRAFLLAFVVAPPSTASAQLVTGYHVDTYTTEQGLPSQSVTSIAQTSDGFLWVAAGGILARFDGHEFVAFTPRVHPELRRRVMKVHAGIGDTLWVLDEGNGVLAVANGRVKEIVAPSPRYILDMAQDGAGQLFGAGMSSVWHLGRGSEVSTEVQPRIALAAADDHPMLRDGAGRVWVVDSATSLRAIGDAAVLGKPTHGQSGIIDSPSTGEVFAVRARGDGGDVRDVLRANGDVVASYHQPRYTRPRLMDRDGRLWVSDENTYAVYERGNTQPIAQIPARARATDPRIIDAGFGCVWSTELALRKLCRVPFRSVSGRFPLGFVRGPRGAPIIWDSTSRLVVLSADGSASRPLTEQNSSSVAFIYVDHRGTTWVSPSGSGAAARAALRAGAVRFVPQHNAYAFADNPQLDRSLWYSAGPYIYNLQTLNDGRDVVRDSAAAGGRVTDMSVAPDGSLWATINTPDALPRVLRIHSGKVTTYSAADGLPAAGLRAVLADDDGTVWLGTYGAGLVRFRNGRFAAVTEADGLSDDVVTSLLDDGLGNLWMGGNRSIHRVARRELASFFDGRTRRVHGVSYGRADGLIEPETTGASGLRDDDGRLWFRTIAGAVVVDPARAIALDSAPPRVHVLALKTDQDTASLPTSLLRLTRGARRVTVTFTATTARVDNAVRFEYRMDGVDKEWVNADGGREVAYSGVKPGQHTFRVRAYNSGGIPAAKDATVEFIVPPFFRETPAFVVLVLLGVIGVAWSGVLYRERHLRERAAMLTRAVDERTATLELALGTVASQADQLRSLDETKSRFFANVSHEFRTPLSLIIGPVEDLRDGRSGELSAPVRRRLDAVLDNARRLLQLVEQLLDVARLESGKLQLSAEVRDVVPLLRRLADSFASLAERRGVAFRLSCPVGTGLRVHYDPDQMEKIISNLVSNALKFTPAGGEVELRAAADWHGDGVAVIEVEDNGPGIAPEHHARVFERFFQVDDSSRRAHEGTGIGLALVRELVHLHGGTVELTSTLGAGSTFTIRLPLAAADARVSPERSIPAVVQRPHSADRAPPLQSYSAASVDVTTVLIVEDNTELLEFLREHLATRYRVLVAENGVRGLEIAREHVPDLVVSDVMMPLMDGQALCEAIKNDADIDFIPVILLTAKASRDSRLAGLISGADDYLTKPVDFAELLVRADNLIASRRRVRERWGAANQQLPSINVPTKAPPRDASSRALLASLSKVMADHLADEDFTVDGMATAVGLGRSTLYRKLEPLLGMSPMDALWEYRLSQAAQWLAETSITVSEVAYGVGFKSVPHFCGRFRERYGETPSGYRRMHSAVPGG